MIWEMWISPSGTPFAVHRPDGSLVVCDDEELVTDLIARWDGDPAFGSCFSAPLRSYEELDLTPKTGDRIRYVTGGEEIITHESICRIVRERRFWYPIDRQGVAEVAPACGDPDHAWWTAKGGCPTCRVKRRGF